MQSQYKILMQVLQWQ